MENQPFDAPEPKVKKEEEDFLTRSAFSMFEMKFGNKSILACSRFSISAIKSESDFHFISSLFTMHKLEMEMKAIKSDDGHNKFGLLLGVSRISSCIDALG
jgi:hypothetical protein